jgi:hypothetical protein
MKLPLKPVTIVRLELGPEDALNYARLEGQTKSLVRESGMHQADVGWCIAAAVVTPDCVA